MDPINPWVDANEVRRLAERLLIPSSQPDPNVRDAGFDSEFIGFASERPSAPLQPPPAPRPPAPEITVPAYPAPPVTQAAPVPSAAPAAPTPSPASPFQAVVEPRTTVRGPFLDRITRFRDWFVNEFSATGMFLLDREGSVIFDESGNTRLHSLARNLALASRKPGSPPANVHLKIGTRATLEVIPVETAYGYLVLGAIVPDTLPPAAIAEVMDALVKAASPPPQGSQG